MKHGYDKKSGEFVCLVDEDDWSRIADLAKIMQSEGWKFLMETNIKSREAIVEAIKECTRKKSLRDMTLDRASKLDGFDQAVGLAENLVSQMNEQIKSKEKGEQDGNIGIGDAD